MEKITKLDKETEKEVRAAFLEKIGNRIRNYREKKNISQGTLGKCLGFSSSTISRIENGTTDIQLSNLPLIGLYCDFPLNSLFPEEESVEFLKTFSKAVNITVRRYSKENFTEIENKRTLTKRIYEEDGAEYIIDVKKSKRHESQRDLYRKGKIRFDADPVVPQKIYDYFYQNGENELIETVIASGKILEYLEKNGGGKAIENTLAEYIVNMVVIEPVVADRNNEMNRKIYAYYSSLLNNRNNQNA